ncbi:MAG: hypothetical protein F6K14_07900 [Symploca sp. SIO2C1]|nr:hypothetical protein [Symploca sp. SIO2C1]
MSENQDKKILCKHKAGDDWKDGCCTDSLSGESISEDSLAQVSESISALPSPTETKLEEELTQPTVVKMATDQEVAIGDTGSAIAKTA